MRVLRRYLLLQLPGWAIAAIILYVLHAWLGLPLWVAGILMAAEIVKDFILFPYLRRAYEDDGRPVTDRLVGQEATVHRALDPEGYVRVRGELWRARVDSESPPVPVGGRVRITSASGLQLIVSAAEDAPPHASKVT